jgi:hypothetical protein
VCTNAASRARDGDPRFAPVALAGYTAADTPDPRVSLLCAPRLANLSPFCGLHPAVRCLPDEGNRKRRPCRAADVGSPTIGARGIDPGFFGIAQASPAGRSSAAARPGGFSGNAFCNKIGTFETCQPALKLSRGIVLQTSFLSSRRADRIMMWGTTSVRD